MLTREIPREQWGKYFDDFSKKYEGWVVDVEELDSEIGDQKEAIGLPLVGISADLKDRENRVEVIIGGRPDADVTRIINAPKRVWVKEPQAAGDEVIEVESEDGTRTLITLRHVPPEETGRQLPANA